MTKKEYKFEKGMRFTVNQQSVINRNLEIKLEEELIAGLKRTGFLKNNFLLEGKWGEWEFYRESIWKSDISIRPYGFDLPTAFFYKEFFKNKGTLKLPMGLHFSIALNPFKKYDELFYGNDKLVLYKQNISLKSKSIDIIITNASEKINKNPWVVAFPVYLIHAFKSNF
ncbi:hypothetical protein [Melioribacter sp. OK-6-Me]|uniref:hypothetical protein n=1 Tax=unclassified Melioribacter TaxID=2627329 RepID=UPI003ED92092